MDRQWIDSLERLVKSVLQFRRLMFCVVWVCLWVGVGIVFCKPMSRNSIKQTSITETGSFACRRQVRLSLVQEAKVEHFLRRSSCDLRFPLPAAGTLLPVILLEVVWEVFSFGCLDSSTPIACAYGLRQSHACACKETCQLVLFNLVPPDLNKHHTIFTSRWSCKPYPRLAFRG